MKQKLIFLLLLSLLSPYGVAFASLENEVEALEEVSTESLVTLAEDEVESSSEGGNFENLNEAVQQSNLVLQLKQKLAQAQYRYYLLKSNLGNAKVNLEDVREVIVNLELVIAQLEVDLEQMDDQILSVKSQMEAKKMEVSDLEEEVQILELQKQDQLELVKEFMSLIYLNRSIYYTDEGLNSLKVLASPDSVSETLQDLTYLDLLEDENQRQIVTLEFISDELSVKWAELRTKRTELEALDEELATAADRKSEELKAQKELLNDMRSEEAILETMLKSADDNEADLLAEIQALEQSVAQMEALLGTTLDGLSATQQEVIQKIEEEMAQNYSITEASGVVDLAWPVSPAAGLTALYSDSGYVELFGVQHGAVDIRANQGSPVTAAADGVVFDIKFNSESNDYAYIMIAHRKGVMTLVGHISGLPQKSGRDLQVGDFVTQGEIIAFSGGMPKSVGSGPRTTGPHVHFEVWQDGARVDPLLYLPLEQVPTSDLPEAYINEMQKDLENEIKEIEAALGL